MLDLGSLLGMIGIDLTGRWWTRLFVRPGSRRLLLLGLLLFLSKPSLFLQSKVLILSATTKRVDALFYARQSALFCLQYERWK